MLVSLRAKRAGYYLSILLFCFGFATWFSLKPLPEDLELRRTKPQFFDRSGKPLSYTRSDRWNFEFIASLDQVPKSLIDALILSEDQRFFSHYGVDPYAIASAFLRNLKALRFVSGGSTITEQVVRIINPRPRTLWSRWLESIEALELERRFSKNQILELYVNQVPQSANSRGFKMAATRVFDRDLSRLSDHEILALVVMLRAPSKLDPRFKANAEALSFRIKQLSSRMFKAEEQLDVFSQPLIAKSHSDPIDLRHFLRSIPDATWSTKTTIDSALQNSAQKLVDQRLMNLSNRNVSDGGALIIDNQTAEILAWVSSGVNPKNLEIDRVLALRQPGSTLKPLLYAYALDHGWTPSTVLDDSELSLSLGRGLKAYRNYSQKYYGAVSLQVALGNSLNIPAIKTVRYFGLTNFFAFLRSLGFDSLNKEPGHYGEGLALGNGEVSLFELVRSYRIFANQGKLRQLSKILKQEEPEIAVISPDTAKKIAQILSNPAARRLEFNSRLMNFPVQTAIKTGTSSGYHDAWALGVSGNYTIGVWLGNLDRTPMADVSGANAAVLLLRSLFREAEKQKAPKRLTSQLALEESRDLREASNTKPEPKILVPTPGLIISIDPRIPIELQALGFEANVTPVTWELDGIELPGEITSGLNRKLLWQPIRGNHRLVAKYLDGVKTPAVRFLVK